MRFVYKQFRNQKSCAYITSTVLFKLRLKCQLSFVFRHTAIESTRTLHENSEVTTISTGGTASCVCNN